VDRTNRISEEGVQCGIVSGTRLIGGSEGDRERRGVEHPQQADERHRPTRRYRPPDRPAGGSSRTASSRIGSSPGGGSAGGSAIGGTSSGGSVIGDSSGDGAPGDGGGFDGVSSIAAWSPISLIVIDRVTR
jgi:hypothetical protein